MLFCTVRQLRALRWKPRLEIEIAEAVPSLSRIFVRDPILQTIDNPHFQAAAPLAIDNRATLITGIVLSSASLGLRFLIAVQIRKGTPTRRSPQGLAPFVVMQTETENSGNSSSFVHISLEANAEELFEIQAVSFNQHKRTGEVAEAAFLAKASNLGFCVAKPWGESERYDFIVDSGHHFWRVQVKSTHSRKRPSYRVRSVWGRTHVYSAAEIDFLVAYLAPENAWYVIPAGSANSFHGMDTPSPRSQNSGNQWRSRCHTFTMRCLTAKSSVWIGEVVRSSTIYYSSEANPASSPSMCSMRTARIFVAMPW